MGCSATVADATDYDVTVVNAAVMLPNDDERTY